MSDRRLLATALAILAFVPGVLAAQPAGGTDARLQRLDSLLGDRLARAEALRVMPADTGYRNVASGPLVVRTSPATVPIVERAVALAYHAISPRGGAVLDSALARHASLLLTDSTHALVGWTPLYVLTSDTARRRVRALRTPLGASLRLDALVDELAAFASHFAIQSADSSLAAWLGLHQLPLRALPAERWADAAIEFGIGASRALRECRGGDDAACLVALGATRIDARLDAWYAPEDYRTLIRHMPAQRQDSLTAVAWMRCDSTGDGDACTRAAHAIPPALVPAPLSVATRELLVDEALQVGGPGALDRLFATRGPMSARLAAAANLPVERLVDRWRDRIIAARPEAMRVGPGLLLASLAWSGLFLAVALTRRGSWS